jgi:predicted RNase H-like nuclease (RuvC/YqgF family)
MLEQTTKQTTENQELKRIIEELEKELTKLNLKVPEELDQTLKKLHTDLADKMLSRQMLSRQPQESEQQPLKAEEFVKLVKLNNIVRFSRKPFSGKEIKNAVVGVKPG